MQKTIENRLEGIITTLNHQKPDVIPATTVFFDINSQNKFVPVFDAKDWKKNEIEYIEFMDNSIVEGGHGELKSRIVERGNNYHLIEFESKAIWKITEFPFNRDYIYYPIQGEADIDKMILPDANDPQRYNGAEEDDGRLYREDGRYLDENELARYASVEERVSFYKENSLFVIGTINGFFSGVWYFCRDFENFLIDLAIRKDFAQEMIRRVGEYNIKSAEELLKRGVHAIRFNDDLGSTESLLISPDFYKEYFYPWHKRLADLCHGYHAYSYMHSHGNINEILPLIIDAGIDIINPVGPTDNMDLENLKEKYGTKITFCGGISKFIGEMSKEEIEAHIKDVIKIGSAGGGFIVSQEGGIPYSMSVENFEFFMRVLKEYRKRYGRKI